jgi:2-polyprenyl-3-methyl-5-hydroxy-6-metoxy-1,4-benzoquinol methylase
MLEGNNILEVASGQGYLSIELMKMGNYNVTGLDISKTFVQIANITNKWENFNQQRSWNSIKDHL